MATRILPLLAKKFLLSRSSEGFLSLIAWVSVVGVALGVTALVVVLSVISGFEGELVKVITGMNGDVIFYSRAEPVSDPEKLQEKLRKLVPEMVEVTASFVSELMVSGPEGVAGGVLEGIELSSLAAVTRIPERVTEGRMPEIDGEITLGKSLAQRIGAKVGTPIRLIIPFAEDVGKKGEGGAPKTFQATVVGIVHMGMHEYDSKFMFGTLEYVQSSLGQFDKVTSFKLKLKNTSFSRRVSDRLTEHFGYPFKSKDWAQLNKNLFYAIKLEKAVIGISLTLIIIVAAFNIVSTLMMMIHDKTREIAILKAMGLRARQSFRLFCLIGLGIGSVGTLIGVVLGLSLNLLIAKTHLIDLPPEIYYIGFLPVVVRWSEVGLVALCAMLITLSATLYPAFQVSRRSPLDGLRYD
jgi:lipoprotein-releasing system permease protein